MQQETTTQQTTRLADIMLNDRGFAFDPNSGETYHLTASGLACVRGLQRGETIDEILIEIMTYWDVDEITARCDLDEFFWELKQLDWL